MEKNKIFQNIQRCKCCLGEDELKDLWTEYYTDGERKIYGEMLSECFALNWEQPSINSDSDSEHICSICVSKLHGAVKFKKEILLSEQLLLEEIKNDSYEVKMEDDFNTDIGTEYLNIEFLDDEDIGKEISDITMESPTKPIQELFMNQKSKSKNYSEEDFKKAVESKTLSQYKAYLLYNVPRRTIQSALDSMELAPTKEINEELKVKPKSKYYKEDDVKQCVTVLQNKTLSQDNATQLLKISKRPMRNTLEKVPPSTKSMTFKENKSTQYENMIHGDDNTIESTRESRKVTRKRTKRYTEADVQQCGESMQSNTTSHNVPQKAIHKELNDCKIERMYEGIRSKAKDPLLQKCQENLDCIMEYTNATPFNGFLRVGYACHFCSLEYEKPRDLKKHTIEMHRSQNMLRVIVHSQKVVKLDVTDLKCNICNENIDTLESVLQHLSEVHKETIHTDTYHFLVPFKFDSEVLKCVVCSEQFKTFKPLNDHMHLNHYKNFSCSICGRGFINEKSLRKHSYRHETGSFKCKYCPKVFSARVRRFAHERSVHFLNNKRHRCGYCSERFGDVVRKKEHEVNVHSATQPIYTCQACSKTYKSQRSLTIHIRYFHLMLRPYKCKLCDFSANKHRKLKVHMVTHTESKE